MGDQYPSLPQGPSNFPVRAEVYPVGPTARSEVPNIWDPCFPDLLWWQYYLAHVYDLETPSIISDGTNPRNGRLQSANGPTPRPPSLSQSRIPEPPLTFVPSHFEGSFRINNRAAAVCERHTRARYSQHITTEEEQIQFTSCQPLERRLDSPSNLEGNAQLCWPSNTNTFSSDVYPSQVPQQLEQWEEPKAARQDPDPGSEGDSESRSKGSRGVHRCGNCSKMYRRRQDLKRHTRDKHEWKRRCPFCCVKWTRPERIRAHLMKKHKSSFTKDQQQEIRRLQGRDETIRFLEKFGNTTFPRSYPIN